MMKLYRVTILSVIAAVFMAYSGSMATAADYDKGLTAARAGDYATALSEWRPLAEHGNWKAQAMLGTMYATGRGVPKNYPEAAKWYQLAAAHGYAGAQYQLGAMYGTGQGVPKDNHEAVKWFRLAAVQSDAQAQASLGIMYKYGTGVLKDRVTAHMWFNIASANGNILGGKQRDRLEKHMSRNEIEEATRRARVCMKSHYQKCD